MTPPDDVVNKLDAIPLGTGRGIAFDRSYIVSRSLFNNGKSSKLVAEELGGADYISLNLYQLDTGARLYPCEMSAEKVIAFVRAYTPQPKSHP